MAERTVALTDDRNLPHLSRYRNSRLYEDTSDGSIYFGAWRPPRIIETKPVTIHIVKPEERNRPDLIAHRVYGNPAFFWVIALRNNLLLPLRDISVGQSLVCPNMDDVMRAMSASFSKNPGTV